MTIYHGERLLRVDPRLVHLVTAVGDRRDCLVLEGDRSLEAEKANIAAGTSHLTDPMNCLHVINPPARPLALAVDFAPYPLDWRARERFILFAGYVYAVADEIGVSIRWGGDWDDHERAAERNRPGQLDDLVHFEVKHA